MVSLLAISRFILSLYGSILPLRLDQKREPFRLGIGPNLYLPVIDNYAETALLRTLVAFAAGSAWLLVLTGC
jgi:hypothetical protein